MLGKKSSEKSAKNVFLYSHEYRDQKMGGEKRAKQFFQEHTNSTSKKWGQKLSEKTAKKFFLYSHEFLDQKMGGKKLAKQFFQKHTNSARKNVWKKIFGK